ncbi:MAG: hypothetical protein V4557_10425 [Bacteroidota bacterium]
MKSKTITAIIIAAALVIFSAVLFFNKKQPVQPVFNITGEWKLDSVYATQVPTNSSWHLSYDLFNDPKNKPIVTFHTDSTLNGPALKDSTSEKYYLKGSILYIDEGKGYLSYSIKTMNDSLFEFINKDSVVFVLKKK